MTAPLNGIPTFVNWTMAFNEQGLFSPEFPTIDAKAILEQYKLHYSDLQLNLYPNNETDTARIGFYRGAVTLECYRKYSALAEAVHLIWEGKFIKPPEDFKSLKPEEIPAYNARVKELSEEDFRAKLERRFDEAQKTLGQPPKKEWDIAVGLIEEESSENENDSWSEEDSWDTLSILDRGYYTSTFPDIRALFPGVELRNLKTGAASAIGRRPKQEDHLCVKMINIGDGVIIPFFGVFDGHDGDTTSFLLSEISSMSFINFLVKKLNGNPRLDEQMISNVLSTLFVHLGRDIKESFPQDRSGSTALLALIINDKLWVVNVGDTRAVLFQNGAPIALSIDANFDSQKAYESVWKRGQNVFDVYETKRVCTLNMHRAVGHKEMTSGVNPRGQVLCYDLKNLGEGRKRLVIASDGLWGRTTHEQVGARVDLFAELNATCQEIAFDLVKTSIEAGSLDNITAVVVEL